MNLRDAKRHLLASAAAGNSVLLESPSGIGKSSLMGQVYRDLVTSEPNVNWGLCGFFAATQTPPDLIGFQFKGTRTFGERTVTVTDPSVPLWMISTEGKPAFLYDKVFCIIEEYGQGEPDVKRACAEIFLNGGTPPWYLPQGSIVVACTNKGARYGVTKDFDFAIARRSKIVIHGDTKVWLEDFADKPYIHRGRAWNVHPITKAWAAANPGVLFEDEPKEQGAWCNPRTLTAFDRYLQMMTPAGGTLDVNDPGLTEVGEGTIGMAATTSVLGHYQSATELPSYRDVIKDPAGCPVPNRADLLLLMAYQLAGWTEAADLAACITYIGRLPKDMAITYVSSLMRRDYKGMIMQPAMQAWINKNAALVTIIQSLAA